MLRFIASVAAIFAFLYFLPPPLSFLGILIAGALVKKPAHGLLSGLIGYLAAYIASGAGIIGFAVLFEIAGFAAVLPFIYYPLTTFCAAFLISKLPQLSRER